MKTRGAVSVIFCGMLALSPLAAQDALKRAEQLMGRGNFAEAEKPLRQAIRDDPNSWRAHAELVLVLLRQHRSDEAVAEGRCAVELAPDNTLARFGYGMALSASGKPLEAAAEFERVAVAEPGKIAPLRAMAAAYAKADDPRAVGIFQELTTLFPENASVREQFAEYLWSSGQEQSGNLAMEEAVATAPFNPEFHRRFGEALFQQQRFLDAVEEFREAHRLAAKSYSIQYLLGTALWQAGKTEEAVTTLEAAVTLDPEKFAAQYDLGKILNISGQAAKAIPHLEKATQVRGQDVGGWLELGHAYEAVGKLKVAEQSYRNAVQLAPNLSAPHYALGRLLVRRGERVEAERQLAVYRELYDKAARMISETDSRGAELNLAWAELKAGKTSEALKRFQALPESPDSLVGRATALSRLGQHAEAVTVLERALLLAPENRKAQALLSAERMRTDVKK